MRHLFTSPHKTPWWLFLMVVACGLIGSYFISEHWSFTQRFQQPDTALAWIALGVSLVLYTQYVTGLRGISYMFANKKRRDKMDKAYDKYTKPLSGGWYMKAQRFVHWFGLAVIIILFCVLVKSTFIDPQIETPTYQQVQELIQSSNKELIDRIDKLLEQNAELIRLLEVQNVSGNDTTTK